MCNLFLIRHGESEAIDYIAGRTPGVHLTKKGKEQVKKLVQNFSGFRIDKIYSSPIERTLETAEIIAKHLNLRVENDNGLIEVDFGEWTGKRFEELKNDKKWDLFNTYRSGTRIPGGETMQEIQLRIVQTIEKIRKENNEKNIIIVSHGDPLRGLITYYLGIPLDFILRFEIDTASVSLLKINDYGSKILCLNSSGDIKRFFPG